MIRGNYYINGKLVVGDYNGNISIGYYSGAKLEFVGRLHLQFLNNLEKVIDEITIYSSDENEKYVDIYDLISSHYHINYDDKYQTKGGPNFVEKSTYHVIADIDGGNQVSFWLVATTELFPEFCDSTFFGGEGEDIYIYFYSGDGEEPEVIDVIDPTEDSVTEVYACDNFGPKYDVNSQQIPYWQSHTSLEDGIGGTFFSEGNVDYPADPIFDENFGVYVEIRDHNYPHDKLNTNPIYIRAQLGYITAPGLETYIRSSRMYYAVDNTDFGVYGLEWLCIGDWHTTIELTSTIANADKQGHSKNIFVTKDIVFPSYGLLAQSSVDDSEFMLKYTEETFVDGKWRYDNFYTLRKFLNIPYLYDDDVDTNLYTFEVLSEGNYNVNLYPNDSRFGYVTGSGEYEYGDVVTAEAIAYPGYHFIDWSDGQYHDTPRSIEVTGDINIGANFMPGVIILSFNVETISSDTFRLIAESQDNIAERGFLLKYDGEPSLDDYDIIFPKQGAIIEQQIILNRTAYVKAYSRWNNVEYLSDAKQIIPLHFIDFITMSGQQYINTGIVPDSTTEAIMDFVQGVNTRLFGAKNNTTDSMFAYGANGRYHLYDTQNGVALTPQTGLRYTATVSAKNSVVKLNAATFNVTTAPFTNPQDYPIWIGNFSQNSGSNYIGNIYGFTIEKGGAMVFDGKPCKFGNEYGLWDVITNTFFGNDGSGEIGGSE